MSVPLTQALGPSGNHMEADDKFYERADGHIAFANVQCADVDSWHVAQSFLYGAARFNIFSIAWDCPTQEALVRGREKIMESTLENFREMLAIHLDDYIENFDDFILSKRDGTD